MRDNLEYGRRTIIDQARLWLRLLVRTRVLFVGLGMSCVALGVRWFSSGVGSIGRDVLASFLFLTGVQILLWVFGIRIELFGSAADSDSGVMDEVALRGPSDDRSDTDRTSVCDTTDEIDRLHVQTEIAELTSRRERSRAEAELAEAEARKAHVQAKIATMELERTTLRIRDEEELAGLVAKKARLQLELEIAELDQRLSRVRGSGPSA